MEIQKNLAGYTGIYRQPYPNAKQYGDTIYVVTDEMHQELNMFILTPGAYREAFMLATEITFHTINIFVPSMDDNYRSDIYRLVKDLYRLKSTVHLYYPEKIKTNPMNIFFEKAFERTGYYLGHRVENFSVEYRKAKTDDVELYDMYVYDGFQYILFTHYMDENKYRTIMQSQKSTIDAIHMPYRTTFYGGLSAKDCAAMKLPWGMKLTANNFACREEYLECLNEKQMNIGQRVPLCML